MRFTYILSKYFSKSNNCRPSSKFKYIIFLSLVNLFFILVPDSHIRMGEMPWKKIRWKSLCRISYANAHTDENVALDCLTLCDIYCGIFFTIFHCVKDVHVSLLLLMYICTLLLQDLIIFNVNTFKGIQSQLQHTFSITLHYGHVEQMPMEDDSNIRVDH